jgi:hypothetical protein
MSCETIGRFAVGALFAWIAATGSGSGGTGGGGKGGAAGGGSPGGGGSGSPANCDYDTVDVPGSSDCKREGACPGGVSCCFTEFVIPPHEKLVDGEMRIRSQHASQGEIIYRVCDPPYVFLGLVFGHWTCEESSRTPFGRYYTYELEPCPDEGKKSPPPTE